MIINKKFLIFVLLAILMQEILISGFDLLNTNFPFLDGVPITSSQALEYRYLLNWYLPIISMSFYFSGYFSDFTRIHGIAFFVRTYCKSKWIIKQYLYMFIVLLFFTMFQIVICTFFELGTSTISITNFIKSLSIYLLTLQTLFSIQLLLELYINPKISHLIMNIYIVASVLMSNQLYGSSKLLQYLFLPNYGMGFKNGLSQIPEFPEHTIDYFTGLPILLIMQILIMFLSIYKIKKMDLL
ncbi:DUF2705 domain-containing protein [Aeribacillus pallidus]|uniref:DUF2705 family protein n=1 Tax=Aeribacillus pallidus TaxID=33936 RepID=UPI001023AF87|nr:DUF2705 domain-containing protein [Aeribacillus pallidus]